MHACMHAWTGGGVPICCMPPKVTQLVMPACCLLRWPGPIALPCLPAEDLLLPVLNQRAHEILNSYNHLRGPVTAPLNVTAVAAGLPDAGAQSGECAHWAVLLLLAQRLAAAQLLLLGHCRRTAAGLTDDWCLAHSFCRGCQGCGAGG